MRAASIQVHPESDDRESTAKVMAPGEGSLHCMQPITALHPPPSLVELGLERFMVGKNINEMAKPKVMIAQEVCTSCIAKLPCDLKRLQSAPFSVPATLPKLQQSQTASLLRRHT